MAFIEVEVGNEIIEFPDTMSDKDIKSALQKKYKPIDPRVQKIPGYSDPEEQSGTSKFMGSLLGLPSLKEQVARKKELSMMTPLDKVKGKAKDYAIQATKIAPLLIGGPVGGTAMKVGSALGRRALTPLMRDMAVTGISKVAEEGLEGASAKDALLAGGGAAGTVGAFGKGLPLIGKGLHMAGKGIGLGAKEVGHMLSGPASDEVVEGIVKYPQVLKMAPKSMTQGTEDAISILESKISKEGEALDKGIQKMQEKLPPNAFVDLGNIKKIYKRKEIDDSLVRKMRKEYGRMTKRIGPKQDKILKALESGGRLSMAEAREANSLLARISRTKPKDSFPVETIDNVKTIKKYILDMTSKPKIPDAKGGNLRLKLPEGKTLRSLNQKYAKVRNDADMVLKDLEKYKPNSDIKIPVPSSARKYAKEGLGKVADKEKEVMALNRLGDEGKSARSFMEQSYITEKLDEAQTANFLRLGAMGGTGAMLGMPFGMASEGAVMGSLGGLSAFVPGAPKKIAGTVAKGVIGARRLNPKIDRLLQRSAPYQELGARTIGKVAGREMFNAPQRTPSGNYSLEYNQKIRNQRRIK